jgi:hypothetical protein
MDAPHQSGTKDNKTSRASLENSLMVEMTLFSLDDQNLSVDKTIALLLAV